MIIESLRKLGLEVFIGGWSCVCHPYIEGATTLLRRQYLNLVDAFSGKKSILAKPAIRPFFLNPIHIQRNQI